MVIREKTTAHWLPQSLSLFHGLDGHLPLNSGLIEYDTKCHKQEMDNANQLMSLEFIIEYLLPSKLPLLDVNCLPAYWMIFTYYKS